MNKVSKNKEKKQKIVSELSEKVKKAKALVFANYTGMTHIQLENLKRAVKSTNSDLVVTKNTLLKRALEISNSKFQIPNFQQPTATLFAYADPIAPLKELAKTIKLLKLPAIKLGIFEGKEITAEEVLKLSTLPSREVLLAQLVFSLKSPIYGLHRVLNWNMQKLAMTLKEIEIKKPK